MTPKLELRNLRKEYDGGDVLAVDDLSLTLGAGETLAILGPSGCGKSTTLNMIVGIETPTSGDILIDGVSVLNQPAGQRSVGLVFQDYAVFTHMTVAQNLAFGLSVRGIARRDRDDAVNKVAELLDLTGLLNVRAAQLGGSELQRVAIGRTLVTEPSLLLLDEPLSNLETEMRSVMRRELRRLQKEIGLTIIYVTHDQIEALSLAQRIAVMSHGKLRQCAETREVYEQPAHVFVAGFIGEPAMNLVTGRLDRTSGGTDFVAEGLRIALNGSAPATGGNVILGVRPDAITLRKASSESPRAQVVRTEARGPETVLTLKLGSAELAAMTPSHDCPSEGDSVGLFFDTSRLALFDSDSQRNLREVHP